MSAITDIIEYAVYSAARDSYDRCNRMKSNHHKYYEQYVAEAEQKLKAYFLGLLPSDKSPYYDQGKYTGEEDPTSSSGNPHFNTGYNYVLKQLRERINEG